MKSFCLEIRSNMAKPSDEVYFIGPKLDSAGKVTGRHVTKLEGPADAEVDQKMAWRRQAGAASAQRGQPPQSRGGSRGSPYRPKGDAPSSPR